MRVSTKDDAEFRFWLTRRFVRLAWPILHKALASSPRIQVQASPDARRELLAFERDTALHKADFATPYREVTKRLPLGEQPLLIAKLQLKASAADTRIVMLAPAHGPGVDLALNDALLHSFIELMAGAAALADWGLPPPTAAAPAPGGHAERPKVTVN